MPKVILAIGVAVILLASAETAADFRNDDAGFQARLCALLLCSADRIEDLADRVGEAANANPTPLRLRELAVLNDPTSPFRWCDLGQAHLREQQIDKARRCFGRAEDLGARNPAILMQIANFHFQLSEFDQALAHTVRVLERVSEYNTIIFSNYSRFNVPLDLVLAKGVPLKKEPAQAYLHFLFAAGNLQETRRGWEWAVSHSLLDDTLAAEYVNQLWRQRQYQAAFESWSAYTESRRIGYPRSGLIYNGDFEWEPTKSILDWQFQNVDGVQLTRDSEVRFQGRYSMRLTFAGETNLDYHHLSQAVAVAPGSYRFRVRVKSTGLTTDEGLRFRIYDIDSRSRLEIGTEQLLGTTAWRLLEKTFEVSAPTRAIAIELVRKPSLKFDNKIAGTLWIDAVSLER